MPVPLLEHDAGPGKPAIDYCRTNGAHAGGRHARVGKNEGQHPRAMVEGACDDCRQVMPGGDLAQTLAKASQFTGSQQFIAAITSWKFHD